MPPSSALLPAFCCFAACFCYAAVFCLAARFFLLATRFCFAAIFCIAARVFCFCLLPLVPSSRITTCFFCTSLIFVAIVLACFLCVCQQPLSSFSVATSICYSSLPIAVFVMFALRVPSLPSKVVFCRRSRRWPMA